MQRASDVDREVPVEVILGDIAQRRGLADAGIQHQRIQGATALPHRSDRMIQVFARARIGDQPLGVMADEGNGGLHLIMRAAGDEHRGPLRRQVRRDGQADALRAAHDQCDLVRHPIHHACLAQEEMRAKVYAVNLVSRTHHE